MDMDGEELLAKAEVMAEMLIREVAHHGMEPVDVLIMMEISQELIRRIFMPYNPKAKHEAIQIARALIAAEVDDGQLEQV